MCGFISQNLDFITLVDVWFFFLCQFHTILIIVALEYHLKSRSVMPPALFFFLRIPFLIQGLWWFHRNSRMVLTFSMKYAIGILIGISKNLQMSLGSIVLATFHVQQPHTASGYHNSLHGQRTFYHYRKFYQTSLCQMHRWTCISYIP